MARGSISKATITQKILDTFEGSFLYDKEIRIPMTEDGEQVQIKCTLTCAKVNVENSSTSTNTTQTVTTTPQQVELTEQEKNDVNTLIEKLGL